MVLRCISILVNWSRNDILWRIICLVQTTLEMKSMFAVLIMTEPWWVFCHNLVLYFHLMKIRWVVFLMLNIYSYIYSSCERMQNGQSEIVKTKVVAKKWLCDSKKDLWYFFEFVFTHPRICTTFYQFFCHQSTISTTLGHHLRFHVYFTLFFLHGECLW